MMNAFSRRAIRRSALSTAIAAALVVMASTVAQAQVTLGAGASANATSTAISDCTTASGNVWVARTRRATFGAT